MELFNYNIPPMPPKIDSVSFVDKLPNPEKEKERKKIVPGKVYLIVTSKGLDGYMFDKSWVPVLKDSIPLTDLSDYWIPKLDDLYFRPIKGYIVVPEISKHYGVYSNSDINYFSIEAKRCYNNDRHHCCHYLNYFENFYDPEHELLMIYHKLKILIDDVKEYNKTNFIDDICKYILSPDIRMKVRNMNLHCYELYLKYSNKNNQGLQYNTRHGIIFMEISILMNMCMPLITHFCKVKKVVEVSVLLLKVFDHIFDLYDSIDVYSKIYETSNSNTKKSHDEHIVLWGKQSIRGINSTTLSVKIVTNIITQIIPKYTYDRNIISFNYSSIIKNLRSTINDVGYEFAYKPLMSSKRDEDNNSEFDKFESRLIKKDEALYLQNKINCEDAIKRIELIYGPFDPEEIEFYHKALNYNGSVIEDFQKDLIFNLFSQYFEDPDSIKSIKDSSEYIKLILAAKKLLQQHELTFLPYIISGRVDRLASRKMISKKDMEKIKKSPNYQLFVNKYRNEKIEKLMLNIIATILTSEFSIIDYKNPELHGRRIEINIPEAIMEEVLLYILLI